MSSPTPNRDLGCDRGRHSITDLTDYDGNPCTVVTSGADGLVRFYGPDGENDNLGWIRGKGSRLLRPTVLTATISDGSIGDIAADADIAAAGHRNRAPSDITGVFTLKDFGAVGDGMTGDTGVDQADAIDAAGRRRPFHLVDYLVGGH